VRQEPLQLLPQDNGSEADAFARLELYRVEGTAKHTKLVGIVDVPISGPRDVKDVTPCGLVDTEERAVSQKVQAGCSVCREIHLVGALTVVCVLLIVLSARLQANSHVT
jgi:hypothetical protein